MGRTTPTDIDPDLLKLQAELKRRCPKRKPRYRAKKTTTQLAIDAFEAVKNFINPYDCGVEIFDGDHWKPIHSITDADRSLYGRYRGGEKTLHYPDGRQFHPFLDYVAQIFSPDHVQDHLNGRKSYYTSGNRGYALLYIDIDAHHEFQDDTEDALELVKEIFPEALWRASDRGANGWLKARYNSVEDYNSLVRELNRVMPAWFATHRIKCSLEFKGSISTQETSGTLAKLPFTCNKRCGEFNYPCLRAFIAKPLVSLLQIERRKNACIAATDMTIAAEWKQQIRVWMGKAAPQITVPKKESTPAPRQEPPTSVPVEPKKFLKSFSVSFSEDLGPDAFTRNLKDIPEIMRTCWAKNQRLPTTEECLKILKNEGRFSGEWADNERRRERRVGQILTWFGERFDPKKCGVKSKPLPEIVEVEHSDLVVERSKFQFDPFTMTGKKKVERIRVPKEWRNAFVALAKEKIAHPADNFGVATNWFRTMFKLLKISWRQSWYQACRDYYDGKLYQIFDKHHCPQKCWRWKAIAPKTEIRKPVKEKHWMEKLHDKDLGIKECSIMDVVRNQLKEENKEEKKEERIHNTLYQKDAQFFPHHDLIPITKPPPWG